MLVPFELQEWMNMFRKWVNLLPWGLVKRIALRSGNPWPIVFGAGNKTATMRAYQLDENSYLCIKVRSQLEKERESLEKKLNILEVQIDKELTKDEFNKLYYDDE